MLVAWIVNTLDVSIRSTVRFPDHVKSLWDDLRDRYSLGNGPCILELKSQIADCKQRGRSVAAYYGELRRLQDELASYCTLPACTCSAVNEYVKIQENQLLHQFCMGLDSKKFGSNVSTLLMMDPLPSINVAYAKIVSEERKQVVSEAHETPRPDAVGFTMAGQSSARSGRATSGEARVCAHCGRSSHEKDRCFELVGWPDWTGRGGGRGSRGGRTTASGGHGFAANLNSSSRQSGAQEFGEQDHGSAPTLTDEH
ncbi:Major viral transcription factor ICP4-like protein [Bienertia sinuspersici]